MSKIINISEYCKNKKVRIKRQFNDYRIAETELSNLENPHWDIISGGVKAISPQPFIYAYVWCTDINGEIAHSGSHGPCPHKIKVVVLKKDNKEEVWNYFIEMAGEKPDFKRAKPYKPDSDAKDIVNALVNNREHPVIIITNSKKFGEIYVINPRKLSKLTDTISENTVARRSKKLRQKIIELMQANQKFELVFLGSMTAFRHKENK